MPSSNKATQYDATSPVPLESRQCDCNGISSLPMMSCPLCKSTTQPVLVRKSAPNTHCCVSVAVTRTTNIQLKFPMERLTSTCPIISNAFPLAITIDRDGGLSLLVPTTFSQRSFLINVTIDPVSPSILVGTPSTLPSTTTDGFCI